ncbi:hypothetical protein [Streptomyces sp. NPDC001070]
MIDVYALISPDGSLEFRDGVPDRMLKDAEPRQGAPYGFTIQGA